MGSSLQPTISLGGAVGEVLRRGGGWSLRFYQGGRRRVIASKQVSYAEAKRMLIEIEARIARGEVGIAERRQSWPTVAQLIEQFLREHSRPRLKDGVRYQRQARSVLRKVLPHLGEVPVDRVRTSDVIKLRDQLALHWSPGTVRNTLTCLGAAFSWGARQGCAPGNPCRGVERPVCRASLDYLSADEVGALLRCCAERSQSGLLVDKLQHARVLLALHTGLRKGELCGLRWCDLDIPSRRLTVARSYDGLPKSGQARHLRLPDVLVPVLTEWSLCCPKTPQGLVFPHRGRSGWMLSRSSSDLLGLPTLLATAGCRRVAHPWHALRHTFASHFIMAGGNILTLQKILGHSDVKITLMYAHLAPDFLGDEMNRLKFVVR